MLQRHIGEPGINDCSILAAGYWRQSLIQLVVCWRLSTTGVAEDEEQQFKLLQAYRQWLRLGLAKTFNLQQCIAV
jgi:hypothetical protein